MKLRREMLKSSINYKYVEKMTLLIMKIPLQRYFSAKFLIH